MRCEYCVFNTSLILCLNKRGKNVNIPKLDITLVLTALSISIGSGLFLSLDCQSGQDFGPVNPPCYPSLTLIDSCCKHNSIKSNVFNKTHKAKAHMFDLKQYRYLPHCQNIDRQRSYSARAAPGKWPPGPWTTEVLHCGVHRCSSLMHRAGMCTVALHLYKNTNMTYAYAHILLYSLFLMQSANNICGARSKISTQTAPLTEST